MLPRRGSDVATCIDCMCFRFRTAVQFTSRRFQGRGGELLDDILALCDDYKLLRPTAVLAACDAGRDDLARELMDRWGTPWYRDWSWDIIGFQWALVSARLGTPDPQWLYDEIAPFGQWFAVGGYATWGCMDFALAELAERLGDLERARGHATAALAAHRRVGVAHLVAVSQAQLARLAGGPSVAQD
jgi:hypothetical protein